jgi:hypothetical protein
VLGWSSGRLRNPAIVHLTALSLQERSLLSPIEGQVERHKDDIDFPDHSFPQCLIAFFLAYIIARDLYLKEKST